jgi:nitrous oxide reductase accessory protein NosL
MIAARAASSQREEHKMKPVNHSQAAWAARGKWLVDKLTERTTPDGRTVLEICEEPIWVEADATLVGYIIAVDLAMERDESQVAA